MNTTESASYRSALVARLSSTGLVTDDEVLDAFGRVPREWFLPRILEREGPVWRVRLPTEESEIQWLDRVYSMDGVCTAVTESGIPRSSSTATVLMAIMIVRAGIGAGSNVLEVGTGTGYNAAILGLIAGPSGSVTSVEIVPEFASEARSALRRFAPPIAVSVYVGDGRLGYSAKAPYDAAIITGSMAFVPVDVLRQVTGHIVMNLRGSLSGALLTVRPLDIQHGRGVASLARRAMLEEIPGAFMELHGGTTEPPSVPAVGELTPIAASNCDVGALIEDIQGAFGFWWQWRAFLPVMVRRRLKSAPSITQHVLAGRKGTLAFYRSEPGGDWNVAGHDSEELWQSLVADWATWCAAGCPRITRLCVEIDNEGVQHLCDTDSARTALPPVPLNLS